jgi:transposase-like protein
VPRSLVRSTLVSGLRSKRRWSRDEAGTVLESLTASGLTVREFADREGLDPQRLHRWRGALSKDAAPAFVEIARAQSTGVVEVVLRSGHVVRVNEGFSEAALRRVVATLGADEC